MDDQLVGRIETLEQQIQSLTQQTSAIARRLRWWRRLACCLVVFSVLSIPVSLGANPDNDKGLAHRIRTLERILRHVTSRVGEGGLPEVVITGANLRIVNGLGRTGCTDEQDNLIPDCPNGLGNLIVGYNESRSELIADEIDPDNRIGPDNRTGSHNIIVGAWHNFSSFGGLVVGGLNDISGVFASVSGGSSNTASGEFSSISGGDTNTASAHHSSISGGLFNRASGIWSSVSGGQSNTASGNFSSVSGGETNTANGAFSAVSGGNANTASDQWASVSGGFRNAASARFSSVSGGHNRSAPEEFNWAAGDFFANF